MEGGRVGCFLSFPRQPDTSAESQRVSRPSTQGLSSGASPRHPANNSAPLSLMAGRGTGGGRCRWGQMGRGRQAGHRRICGVGCGWRPPARHLGYPGGEEEEGYCYSTGGRPDGCSYGFYRVSGWVKDFTISVEERMQQSHPVHPKSMVVEDESLDGRLQKDPLSLLPVLWAPSSECSQEQREASSLRHILKRGATGGGVQWGVRGQRHIHRDWGCACKRWEQAEQGP